MEQRRRDPRVRQSHDTHPLVLPVTIVNTHHHARASEQPPARQPVSIVQLGFQSGEVLRAALQVPLVGGRRGHPSHAGARPSPARPRPGSARLALQVNTSRLQPSPAGRAFPYTRRPITTPRPVLSP